MPPKLSVSIESISNYIEKRKATSFNELASHFQCSIRTIFRQLTKVEYFSSYNKSGAGLTLTHIPNFNKYGLWKHEKFYFSKWGSLKQTIRKIIDLSTEGLYARNLQDILEVRVNNHLSICVKEKLIVRNNDFGHPIYFSMIPKTREKQYKERIKISKMKAPSERSPLSKENIIRVLVTIIRYHETTVDKLIPVLETEGIHISKQSIKWVLKKYDIEKKGSL